MRGGRERRQATGDRRGRARGARGRRKARGDRRDSQTQTRARKLIYYAVPTGNQPTPLDWSGSDNNNVVLGKTVRDKTKQRQEEENKRLVQDKKK